MSSSFLISISLILFGSASQLSQIDMDMVRYDGVYECKSDDDIIQYIRFYKDGSVITTSTSAQISKLKVWFKKELFVEKHHSKGTYKYDSEGVVRFTSTSGYGSVNYACSVIGGLMLVSTHSGINGHRGKYEFRFVRVPEFR